MQDFDDMPQNDSTGSQEQSHQPQHTQPNDAGNNAAIDPEKVAEQKRKTIYFNRLTLYAQPNEAGKRPRLVIGLFDGNPRLVIRTADPKDEQNNYGQIVAAMDAHTADVMCQLIVKSISAANGYREKIINKSTWKNGEKQDQPVESSCVIIGKDSEGCIYISIHEENRPNIRFFFGPTEWHSLVKSDGSAYSKAELSGLYARAWANNCSAVMATVIGYGSYVSTYTDHDKDFDGAKPIFSQYRGNNQKSQYKGNKGNYQRGNYQNGGNYQKGGYNRNNGYNRGYNQNGYNNNRGNNRQYQNNYNQNRQQQMQNELPDEDIQF